MSKEELTKNRHLAKQSGYGTYIDFPFITTDSIVEGRKVIVGELADYIETLESICTKYEDGLQKLAVQEIIKDDKERLHAYDTVFSRIYTKLLLPPNPVRAEEEIYAMARNLEMGNYLCEQKDQQIAELKAKADLRAEIVSKEVNKICKKIIEENAELKAENEELRKNTDGTLIVKFGKLEHQLKEKDEIMEKVINERHKYYVKSEDLEKQLKEKDEEISKFNRNWAILCDYLGKMIVEGDENEEIYSDILRIVNEIYHYNPEYSTKAITHQVCEKIRKLAKK